MIDAEIKTRNGSVIHIKGTTEEVNEILALWQRREDFLVRRRVFFKYGDEKESRFMNSGLRGVAIPPKTSLPSPNKEIRKLVDSGFFSQPRTLGEIKKELNKTVNIPISSIHPTLIALIGHNILERIKNEEEFWVYKIKQGGR